jgi:hypothetical protein
MPSFSCRFNRIQAKKWYPKAEKWMEKYKGEWERFPRERVNAKERRPLVRSSD